MIVKRVMRLININRKLTEISANKKPIIHLEPPNIGKVQWFNIQQFRWTFFANSLKLKMNKKNYTTFWLKIFRQSWIFLSGLNWRWTVALLDSLEQEWATQFKKRPKFLENFCCHFFNFHPIFFQFWIIIIIIVSWLRD
jgi:hypothetical protein